ncbi:DUF2062 domain-containing protein [Psychrosphaera sp. F3M07]|jgi:uncharacterized protein (DUF2062 family)|uniref:DUF2062 domain-containing protein n=1 Tax=Psychrosphaera sp. F3M07 TaxID=2841560 RepID=UPI001C0953E5|nr:DUF2062 domain-containing protein [Psychrosphaera sp. F3M07]MBU2916512.1 DUF2062 domain-containing protein [Psychrosphaera sp. F3M07]
MPRKFIKRFLPDHQKIKQNKAINMFGTLLHDANLWHLNRKSARGAFAIGLFNAFIPVPFQMYLSALFAIIFKVNLPLSVGLVWISNPLTMPPLFYGCYKVGEWILGPTGHNFAFQLSWDWLVASLSTIGPTFLFGCLVVASVCAIIGFFGIDILWRYSVARAWSDRKLKRLNKNKDN